MSNKVLLAGECRRILDDYACGAISYDTLRKKDSLLLRMRPATGPSLIMKLWNRRGPKALLRTCTSTDPASRERRALLRLSGSSFPAPGFLGSMNVSDDRIPYTHVVFTEDLGQTRLTFDAVKEDAMEGNESEVAGTESKIVLLTKELLGRGIVDVDHTLVNILITENGELWRVDFELAHFELFRGALWRLRGRMLGHLLASYTYAVQPQLWRSQHFSTKVAETLQPSSRIRSEATRVFQRLMNAQYTTRGIDSRISLSW